MRSAKSIILFLFICLNFSATRKYFVAHHYYFSTSGSDFNSGISPLNPFKTIAKLNSLTLAGDDTVSLKGIDVFYGAIVINQSGTSGHPIVFNSYGTGKATVTGFTTVQSWTNLGSNIWESSGAVSALNTCTLVSINGVNTAMGRYPKTGWLYNTHANDNSIISNAALNSAVTNWTGAQAVIRKTRWIIDRCPITSASGSTLITSNPSTYPALQGWGFFIQNDTRTLTQQNDWYYTSTKKIRVYSTSAPTSVNVSSIDTLVYFIHVDYLTFDNLQFTGANGDAFYPVGTHNTIQNCDFDFNYNGIFGQNFGAGLNSTNFTVNNCTFNHTNNNAINITTEFINATVTNNVVQNTGVLVGMSGSDDGNANAFAVDGASGLVQYNQITNTGYCGIVFGRANTAVRNNFINYSCVVKDDGGAIYMYNDTAVGKVVDKNICIYNLGNNQGTDDTSNTGNSAHGIYIDGNYSGNVSVTNNNIAYSGNSGIFLHNSHSVTCTGNTVFDSRGSGLLLDNNSAGATMTNLVITNNIFFAKYAPVTETFFTLPTKAFNQLTMQVISSHNDLAAVSTIGTLNNNYYARPIDDSLTINTQPNGQSYTPVSGYQYRTLLGWQTYSGLDANSHKTYASIPDTSSVIFRYNYSASPVTLNLGAYTYRDVAGVLYPLSVTIPAYSSVILMNPTTATVAQGGILIKRNVTLYFPSSSTLLNGLVSYYKLDEFSGSAVDSKGSHTGTLSGSPVQGVAGKINTAYSFAGTSYVDAGSTAALQPTTALSISVWIKTTTTGFTGIVTNYKSTTNGYDILVDDNNKIEFAIRNSSVGGGFSSSVVTSSTSVTTGNWVHVVGTFDGTTQKLYINGVSEGTPQTWAHLIAYDGSTFEIGARDQGLNFSGTIDETGVWNKGLTSGEVTQLYNSGNGKPYPY